MVFRCLETRAQLEPQTDRQKPYRRICLNHIQQYVAFCIKDGEKIHIKSDVIYLCIYS